MKKILVIGELNTDLIMTGLPHLPVLGQEILCAGFSRVLGSSSAIFAVKLARLGAAVDFMGLVGDDDDGRFLIEQLRANGVNADRVMRRANLRTGVTLSLSLATDRAMVTYLGAMAALRVADLDLSCLVGYDHLHMASYFLQCGLRPDLARLFDAARQSGLSISFDTGWDPLAQWGADLFEALDYVDIFLPNESEALALGETDDLPTALHRLTRPDRQVVVKLGAEGCVALTGAEQVLHLPPFPITPVDTTGAGDSFDAGFVYARLVAQQPLAEAMRFANACGALAATVVGGATHAPTAAEVAAFIAAHPEVTA